MERVSDWSCTLVFQTLIESSASHSFIVLFILFTPCSLCPPNSSLAMVKEWQERMIKTSSSFYPCPSLCIVCLSFYLTVCSFLSFSWQALASEWIKFSSFPRDLIPSANSLQLTIRWQGENVNYNIFPLYIEIYTSFFL